MAGLSKNSFGAVKWAIFPLLFFCISTSHATEKIEMGIAANFSAMNDTMWNDHANFFSEGTELALDEYRTKLKSRGIEIELKKMDYGNEKLGVIKIANEPATSKVVAVIGFPYSSDVLLAGPVFNQKKLLLLSPTATADRIGSLGRYVRTCTFSNSYQGSVLANAAASKGLKRIAIVSISDCAYCQSLRTAFRKQFEANGGTIVADETVLERQAANAKSMDTLSSQLIGKSFDAILIPNYQHVSATLIASLYDRRIRPRFWLGGDGWGGMTELFKKVIGPRSIEAFALTYWNKAQTDKRSTAFLKAYRKKFHKEPADIAAISHDAMSLLIEAILRAKSIDRETIVTALESLSEWDGVTGHFLYAKGSTVPEKFGSLLKLFRGKVSLDEMRGALAE